MKCVLCLWRVTLGCHQRYDRQDYCLTYSYREKTWLLQWQLSMWHGSLVCLKFMVVCIWQENHWFVKCKNHRWFSLWSLFCFLCQRYHRNRNNFKPDTYLYVQIFVLYFKFAGKINLVAAIYPSKHWKS